MHAQQDQDVMKTQEAGRGERTLERRGKKKVAGKKKYEHKRRPMKDTLLEKRRGKKQKGDRRSAGRNGGRGIQQKNKKDIKEKLRVNN